jgi:LPS-assembly lipoprotein
MSSADRIRALRGPILALALGLGLAGCFRPMYGPGADGRSVTEALAAVKVEPVADRLGHHLTQDLVFELTGGAPASQTRYRLTVKATQNVVTPVVDSSSGRADAATVLARADYVLTRIDGGAEVTAGTATASATFDRIAQRFAAARATRDAEIRVARVLADQIRLRVAAALATGR